MKKTFKFKILLFVSALTGAVFCPGGFVFAEQNRYLPIQDGNYLLALVNKQTDLRHYVPKDLADLSEFGKPGMYLREVAIDNFWGGVMADVKSEAGSVQIISAYRSVEHQNALFNRYSSYDPNANRYSAKPGQSQHQLGTTVDLGSQYQSFYNFRAGFGGTVQGQWLAENSWKHGFVISYPEGKEDLTGYIYEPWHFRYIGIDSAKEYYESQVTLDEYLETKEQFYRDLNLSNVFIRSKESGKIYDVSANGFKRHIQSLEILASYVGQGKPTIELTQDQVEGVADATIIKLIGEPKLYLLNGSNIKWIESEEVFLGLGHSAQDIVEVNKIEFFGYNLGESISQINISLDEV